MAAMAAYLGISVTSFQSDYLVKKGYKFSIKEKIVGMSHDCIFFDRQNNGCKVYEVRPKQCITFPFWEYYKTRVDELKRECPGIVDA